MLCIKRERSFSATSLNFLWPWEAIFSCLHMSANITIHDRAIRRVTMETPRNKQIGWCRDQYFADTQTSGQEACTPLPIARPNTATGNRGAQKRQPRQGRLNRVWYSLGPEPRLFISGGCGSKSMRIYAKNACMHVAGRGWVSVAFFCKKLLNGDPSARSSDGHHTSSIPMWMELSCVPAGDYIRQRSCRTSPREGGGWKTAFGENMPSQSGQTTHVPPGSFFFLDSVMQSAQRQL